MPPAAASGGANQPAATKELPMLNQRSAGLAAFDIGIFRPKLHAYPYKDKKTNEMKKGQTFRSILVSRENPAAYLQAELSRRGTDAQPLEAAD